MTTTTAAAGYDITTLRPEFTAQIEEAILHYPLSKRSASLPLLHLFQEEFGYISEDAMVWIADKLELEPINILELVTFYPMFRQKPAGKNHIRVCRTLSCALAGSYGLKDTFCDLLGLDKHHDHHHEPIQVSADGEFSIEFVECLASCGTGPVCMANDDFHENVTPARAEELVKKCQATNND
ncbi:MAG: NAD(P)H-dependent oxidoreductase subunit E [Verrucomicrobiales bacterium]